MRVNNSQISEKFSWYSYSFSDIGKVRKIQEDDYMCNDRTAHWVVADGMGGHEKGDVASLLISETLEKIERTDFFADFVDEIEDRLSSVNQKLQLMAGDGVIGSTVAGIALQQQHALFYWAGDSRIYLLRDKKLNQLSIDHTYTQELIDQGRLTLEKASEHPQKNIITRAVGADSELFIDFEMIELRHGDLFLVCSDGIEKELSHDDMQAILNTYRRKPQKAGQVVLDEVLERGARDNVTFVLVEIEEQ